jgi:hypothetical protein
LDTALTTHMRPLLATMLLTTLAVAPQNDGMVRVRSTRDFTLTVGLEPNGKAWCWGSNDFMELGTGLQFQGQGLAPVPVRSP